MKPPKLAAVPPADRPARPRLRGDVTIADAYAAHPYNAENARRWLAAVAYLRDSSITGWALDTHDYPTRKDTR